jgi:hypothetical protein
VVILYLYLTESICRFGSCYLHQNRFPGRNLCYIDNIAFVVSPVASVLVVVIAAAVIAADDYSSIQNNHVVLLYLRLMVLFTYSLANMFVTKLDRFSA